MADLPDMLSAALRGVSFVLLLTAAGIALFSVLFGDLLSATREFAGRLGWKLSIAAIAAVVGHQALQAARMAGEMSGVLDPSMQMMSMQSPGGASFVGKSLGLVLLAVGLKSGSRWLSLAGSVVAVGGFALTGHTSVGPHRAAAASLVTIHLLIVAFWIGSLWPLYKAAGEERPPVAARVIAAFSRIASWIVPLILFAGIALAWLLIPSLAVFREPYGRLLLTKLALFAALMCLATLNRYRFGPACATSDTRAFRLSVAAEYVVICGVLAVTAVMTMFYSPEVP